MLRHPRLVKQRWAEKKGWRGPNTEKARVGTGKWELHSLTKCVSYLLDHERLCVCARYTLQCPCNEQRRGAHTHTHTHRKRVIETASTDRAMLVDTTWGMKKHNNKVKMNKQTHTHTHTHTDTHTQTKMDPHTASLAGGGGWGRKSVV